MTHSLVRLGGTVLGLALALASHGAWSQSAADGSGDATAFIKELGLKETPTALRDHPGWRKPRRIVIVQPDGYDVALLRTAAPGVELIFVPDAAQAEAAASRADAVIGFCTGPLLAQGKNIRWLQVMNAGVERCLVNSAIAERNILLTNMQRVAGPVMAEHVMAMTLSLARGLPGYMQLQARSEWNPPDEENSPAVALQGKTMLIAGLGGIGTEVARRAHAFGMRVLATNTSDRPPPEFVSHLARPTDLLALAREADVVVNTLPLTPETSGLFDEKAFAAMKPRAFFINVGRGKTVVTDALVKALKEKRLGGAGLDVTEPEPLPADHPLWKLPNVIITPHVAADTDGGSTMRWQVVRENLRRYVAGERMLSVVDVKRGY